MWSITTNCIMQYDKILSFLVGGYFLQVCELFYLPLKGFCILSAYSRLFSFPVQWHLQICPKNHPKTPMKMWCWWKLPVLKIMQLWKIFLLYYCCTYDFLDYVSPYPDPNFSNHPAIHIWFNDQPGSDALDEHKVITDFA